MNKAERIKAANAEWHRLNEIDTKIRYLFDELMCEMKTLNDVDVRFHGHVLHLIKCIELLSKSKGD
tara:strand:- start:954 stop:1151 length:198 start_codon:yes stop_codon:yes gene_type:complete